MFDHAVRKNDVELAIAKGELRGIADNARHVWRGEGEFVFLQSLDVQDRDPSGDRHRPEARQTAEIENPGLRRKGKDFDEFPDATGAETAADRMRELVEGVHGGGNAIIPALRDHNHRPTD
jgi:hypothetical protein